MTLTEAFIKDLIPLRERGKGFDLMSFVWAIGTVAGIYLHFPLYRVLHLLLFVSFYDRLLVVLLLRMMRGHGFF